ncbi:MAG: hypothetical protein M1832_006312 [Thelocarpon impressellum]|nr:MAG: hypothetical protein M1832_006312 [Thelocarpon impressellum]
MPRDPSAVVEQFRVDLRPYEQLYRDLHAQPELSLQEARTAATVAEHLRRLAIPDLDLHVGIGGHGVAAVLRNGPGRTVLLRADMDALPVRELTGLAYASEASAADDDGVTRPVMHACGHDMHVACLLAAAATLAGAAERWRGTVIALFQPNEERAGGARAMVDDGLYTRVPVPDVVLGQHVMPFRAGAVGTRRGLMASAADSFRVTLFGRGGHASQPHRTVDPVVMAAHVVVRLQGIVAREVPPEEGAVVTVGSIQAGLTENVIAEEAVLRVNVRSYSEPTRARVLAAVERVVRAESAASNAPREPVIEPTSRFPFTVNDDGVTGALEAVFGAHFGADYSDKAAMLGGSDDFAALATARGVPYCYWTFGGTDAAVWDEAERAGRLAEDVPINHSPLFAPAVQPTLRAGADALVLAALTFLD